MMNYLFSFLTLCACTAHAATFDIVDLRNTNGVVRCALYRDKAGFPDTPEKASIISIAQISSDKKSSCSFDLSNEASASVAVAVLHDEDNDGKMKTNMIGIPREGWSVSNNAKARTFGPPAYEDAKFDPKNVTQQTLKMNY